MLPRLLLDTHILIRWLVDASKLSRTQVKSLEAAVRRGEPIGLSAVSLLEIAVPASGDSPPFRVSLSEARSVIRRIEPLPLQLAFIDFDW